MTDQSLDPFEEGFRLGFARGMAHGMQRVAERVRSVLPNPGEPTLASAERSIVADELRACLLNREAHRRRVAG